MNILSGRWFIQHGTVISSCLRPNVSARGRNHSRRSARGMYLPQYYYSYHIREAHGIVLFAQGNILIDDDDNVRLTDFGSSLLMYGTSGNYGSKHDGGAHQFRSPELHDPKQFGLSNGRPTSASDIFAFAMAGVEVGEQ